jgi:hypothetical protein
MWNSLGPAGGVFSHAGYKTVSTVHSDCFVSLRYKFLNIVNITHTHSHLVKREWLYNALELASEINNI